MKKTSSRMTPKLQLLFEKAKEVRNHSYSPYSHCKVGSAIRLESGSVFTGCNVENASFGGAICAERTAIVKAISEEGSIKIKEVMVVTEANPPWPPCGFCLQVIAEFGTNCVVYTASPSGKFRKFRFRELLGQAFTPRNLQVKKKKAL